MKKVFVKTLVGIVSVMLVVPFVAAALLVGARAVAESESTEQRLLLVGLAFGGALFSGLRNFGRGDDGAREGHDLRAASPAVGARGHAFMSTRGL
ncbi:MAG TPA: hypothetical protein VGX48_07305 [Pyrinomonadaceae bacterium]|jgi:hypothetical protein|nr:hypothetical protein [Pyrinomonadaceae bacterium]